LARKEFIGISSEYDRLRIVKVCTTKNGIELLGVDTFDLPFPLSGTSDSAADPMDFADEFEDLFDTGGTGLESEFPGLEGLDNEGSETTSVVDDLDESFDMTSMEDETDVATENERLFAEYLKKLGEKKYRFGLHIPLGKTTYQFLKNVDPDEMKKKDRREFFIDKLRPIHNKEAEPDEYAWSTDPQKNTLLAYNSEDRSLISLVELAETYFKGKLIIQERVPDENIWAGLASINYHLKEDDITGLIAIGQNTSRILFMRGEHIINVLPIITEGETTEDILNTIFSKILFEIDKGDLPKITRLLIVKSLKLTDKVKEYFQNQFDDVEVEFLTLNPNIVSYSDDILDSPVYLQPYLTALGAAWAASGAHGDKLTTFSILPEYIREKQRVLKLEWHGVLLLVLIALTPLLINSLYNTKAEELRGIEQQIQLTENEIAEYQPIANMTEDLIAELTLMQGENDRLLELSQFSQKWSQVFNIFNNGFNNLSGVWLSTLGSDGENIDISGVSLTREQVPNISSLYSDGNVQQVQETEIREEPVYSFSMQINNFRTDLEEFVPEIPRPSFDPENNQGSSFAFQGADGNPTNHQPEVTEEEDAGSEEPATGSGTLADFAGSSNSNEQETDSEQNSGSAAEETVNEPITPTEDRQTEVTETINTAQPAIESESVYGLRGPVDQLLVGSYTIVLHSIPDNDRARLEKSVLESENFKATLWPANVGGGRINWRIGVGQFETVSDALSAIPDLPEPFQRDHFIIKIKELGEQ
jgi:hypothetical protein